MARDRDNSKDETATAKGREKKRSNKKERKALRKSKAEKEAREQGREEKAAGQASSLEKQTVLDLLDNPETKGRGLVAGNREKKEQVTGPHATTRGECSGQKRSS